jgi:hypothetical protein
MGPPARRGFLLQTEGAGHEEDPVYASKEQFLEHAEAAFSDGKPHDESARPDELLKKIGELTMERDTLQRGLRRFT